MTSRGETGVCRNSANFLDGLPSLKGMGSTIVLLGIRHHPSGVRKKNDAQITKGAFEMPKFDLEARNKNIDLLCEIVENYQALVQIWPGYVNDPADVDREGCFV